MKRLRSEATQGVWGERSPMPHWGCHEVTGGKLLHIKIECEKISHSIFMWSIGGSNS